MAEFAPVAPIQILEGMKEAKCIGSHHLLLTHHVLEEPDRFRECFRSHTFPDIPSYTIFMDNSVVELGSAVTDAMVLEACQIVGDDGGNWVYPVLTDVMGDGPATIEASERSYDWWYANAPEYLPMVVLQGNDWESFTKTADYFLTGDKFRNLGWAGIPRILTSHLGTRQLAVQYVDAIRPDINLHLFGFSEDVTDDIIAAQHPGVQSMDSAVPVRYPYKNGPKTLYTPSCEVPPRDPDWFEHGKYEPAIANNLLHMRQWVA